MFNYQMLKNKFVNKTLTVIKKIILFFMLIFISALSFSQQTKTSAALTKQDYLQKSKKQKTTAWIFLGGGAALALIGVAIPEGDLTDELNPYCLCYYIHENDGIKGALVLAGGLSMLGSIPFFIASGKNNRRAMNVSFKNEPVPQIQNSSFVYRYIPSFTLKISL